MQISEIDVTLKLFLNISIELKPILVCVLVAQSCPTLEIPWTVAHQPPLSMGFPKQEYWSEFPFLFPGDLPDPGIKPGSPAL